MSKQLRRLKKPLTKLFIEALANPDKREVIIYNGPSYFVYLTVSQLSTLGYLSIRL